MHKNKTIFKNSIILYIRLLIVSVFGLITSRYTIQALGLSDYGLFSVVGSVVFMMAFLNNVMVTTTYRYIAFEEGTGNLESVNKVFNVSLIIHILIAFFVLITAETLGMYYVNNYLNIEEGKTVDAVFIFRLSIYSVIVSILGVPYQGLLVAKEKFVISSIIDIVRVILYLGVVFLVLYFNGNKLRLFTILTTALSALPPFFYFLYSFFKYKEIIRWNFQSDRNIYKEMAFFSGWTMLGAAAVASELQFSVLLINLFFGTIVNAGFAIACAVGNIVKMFSQSLNQAVIPQITKSYSGGDKERTIDLVVFTSKYSFFLILFPSIPLLLETDFILQLWLGKVPTYAPFFIQLIVLNAIIASTNAGIPALVQASGKIKYFQIILSALSLIGLPISYYFFKIGFPPYTLSIVYLIIASLNLFVWQLLLKVVLNFDTSEFFKKVYILIIFVCLSTLPLFLIKYLQPASLSRFYLLLSVSTVWLMIVIFLFGMSGKEKANLIIFFKKQYSFLKNKFYFK